MIGSQAWTLPLSGLVEVSQSSESPCPACTFPANSGPRTTQLSHPTQSPIGASSKVVDGTDGRAQRQTFSVGDLAASQAVERLYFTGIRRSRRSSSYERLIH